MTVRYQLRESGAPNHSYEEIRRVALDVLAKRESVPYEANQFGHLSIGVAAVLESREGYGGGGSTPRLSTKDFLLFQEVFWELFRQGVITLGLNESN